MARPVRIGVLVPSTNQVVEPDFASLMPPGVTFHTERLWNGESTPEGGGDGSYLLKMNADLERGVRYLASANLDIIAYCCTSGTYHAGSLEYDGHLSRRISAAGGLPSVTAVTASLEALRHVGARRLSIVGPYGNFLLRERLTPLLESQGFELFRLWVRPTCSSEPWTRPLETRIRRALRSSFVIPWTQPRMRCSFPVRHGGPWRWFNRWRSGWVGRL